MGYPRFRQARAHKHFTRTAGDQTISSTTYVPFDTALDIVLSAQAGDTIEYGISGASSANTNEGYMNVALMVSGSIAGYFVPVTATHGVVAWHAIGGTGAPGAIISGSALRTLGASEITGGVVTLRLMVRVIGGSRLYHSSTALAFQVWAKNLGPADPT